MTAPYPGTARGDLTLYDGRTTLGFVRGSTAGVYAYDADGKPVGTFADHKAAQTALRARAATRGADA